MCRIFKQDDQHTNYSGSDNSSPRLSSPRFELNINLTFCECWYLRLLSTFGWQLLKYIFVYSYCIKFLRIFHTCKLNCKKEWDLPEQLPWETRQEQQRFVLWWWALIQIPHRKTQWFLQIAQWLAPLYPILKQSQKIRVIFHCTIYTWYTCSIYKCFKIWCLRLLPQYWHINHRKKHVHT